ncbi:MAG: c-type cytochrome [Planctomycetes bacterium]|nr:c-type cytochrome [Planctomycetota bacterium]
MKLFSARSALLSLVAVATALTGCMRGGTSSEPPVHLVLDMDFQPKLRAQAKTEFAGWPDGRSMRAPVADPFGKTLVVAQGSLPDPKLANRTAGNAFVTQNPVPVDGRVLARGQEMFDIHCAVCHGYSGQGGNHPQGGHGLVGRRWPVAIPNFHFVDGADNRVPQMPDGEFFEVITHGKGTMPAYGARIGVEDRWAIVHYIRALQRLSK